jgi:hypothetical protein
MCHFTNVGDPLHFGADLGADPDPTPEPDPFFSDLKDAKQSFFHNFFL